MQVIKEWFMLVDKDGSGAVERQEFRDAFMVRTRCKRNKKY